MAVHCRTGRARYAIPDGPAREAAFGSLALEEFEDLGLADALRAAVAERPSVAARVAVVLLAEARGRADEGVTWEPGGTHLGIRVDLARYDDPEGLAAWARHVLGHAQDTADPAFGSRAGLAEARLGVPAWRASTCCGTRRRCAAAGRLRGCPPGGKAADSRSRHRSLDRRRPRGAPHAAVDACSTACSGPRRPTPSCTAWTDTPERHDAAAGPVARPGPTVPPVPLPGD